MRLLKHEFYDFKPETDHARFSPSSSERWFACPGSHKREQAVHASGIKALSNNYIREGVIAHEILERSLIKDRYGFPFPPDMLKNHASALEASSLHSTVEEMLNYAQEFMGLISPFIPQDDTPYEEHIEKGIPIMPPDCFGTADYMYIDKDEIRIVDYKFGKGHSVSPDCLQLKLYALGVYLHHPGTPDITVGIYQPRVNPNIEWFTHSSYALAAFKLQVEEVFHNAKAPNAENNLYPGSHCYFCPARSSRLTPDLQCPAIREKETQQLKDDFAEVVALMHESTQEMEEKDRQELAIKLIAIFPRILKLHDTLRNEFTVRLQQKERIPGFSLVEKKGRRTMNLKSFHNRPELLADAIVKKYPQVIPDQLLRTDIKMQTMTKIEKLIGEKLPEEFITAPVNEVLELDTELVEAHQKAILTEQSTKE